ncbi:MAG: hypothetical protein JWO38_3568 [Gemmataceae bacterium]|nr:hypothetical protein [Gemmataceae bacterium]
MGAGTIPWGKGRGEARGVRGRRTPISTGRHPSLQGTVPVARLLRSGWPLWDQLSENRALRTVEKLLFSTGNPVGYHVYGCPHREETAS